MILCTTHPTPLGKKPLQKETFEEFIFADNRGQNIYQFCNFF